METQEISLEQQSKFSLEHYKKKNEKSIIL